MKTKNSTDKVNVYYNLDWLDAHPELKNKRTQLPLTPEQDAFSRICWPFAEVYHAPIDTVFLIQFSSLPLLNRSKSWIIRDGLIPLLWFFKKFPKPTQVQTKMYVHHSLEPYIPLEWSKYFGLYDLYSQDTQPNDIQNLILCGVVSENFFQIDNFHDFFQNLEKQSQYDFQKLNKKSFLYYQPLFSSGKHSYLTNYYSELMNFFGPQIQGLEFSNFQSIDDYSNHAVIDVNSSNIYIDNALVHFLLGRGAKLISNYQGLAKFDRVVPISEYHGYKIKEDINTDISIYRNVQSDIKKMDAFQKKIFNVTRSSSNNGLPWPNWFAEWVGTPKKSNK